MRNYVVNTAIALLRYSVSRFRDTSALFQAPPATRGESCLLIHRESQNFLNTLYYTSQVLKHLTKTRKKSITQRSKNCSYFPYIYDLLPRMVKYFESFNYFFLQIIVWLNQKDTFKVHEIYQYMTYIRYYTRRNIYLPIKMFGFV